MIAHQVKVELIWVDENGIQIGAKLSFGEEPGRTFDVTLDEIRQNYKDKICNATINEQGLQGTNSTILPEQQLVRKTERQVATYTLMHADTVVCKVYPIDDRIEIVTGEYLPFALSGIDFRISDIKDCTLGYINNMQVNKIKGLTVSIFEQWLTSRIDNLSRTYMNRVYIARKVGRDREKILRDSCAISIIDNFWVLRSDIKTTWDELKSKRDKNLEIVNIALTGEIKKPPDFKRAEEDTISLFTTKGVFPKAVYKGKLLKKGNNAEYESIAYRIGSFLNISIAEAVKTNGVVECKLFTSEAVSMVHAGDLIHLTDYETDKDEHRALYDYFSQLGRVDITRQLERLYIFNYLVENTDLHYENFGFLYDSYTFKITGVAPGYDYNSAFLGSDDKSAFYLWIYNNLPNFMHNHTDIKNQLQSDSFSDLLNSLFDLSQMQINSLRMRADYLCQIVDNI